MSSIACPRCKASVPQLFDVKVELQNFLINHKSADGFFKKVCEACLGTLEAGSQDFSLIQNRMSPGELMKMQLWNKRIDWLKDALAAMKAEKYEEALPKYDEYIKAIEQVLGVRAENLTAQSFIMSGRSEELPVYSLVLWDLIVCHDGKSEVNQQAAADKMLALVKGTSLRKTLRDRALQYQKNAKNKKFFKKLQKDFRTDRGCFVATYAYESEEHPQVLFLRGYRDQVLQKSMAGRLLIEIYYLLSPTLVKILSPFPRMRSLVQKSLDRLIKKISSSSMKL